MTLNEAIEHCREVAGGDCTECAREHEQLAEWLAELAERRKADRMKGALAALDEFTHRWCIDEEATGETGELTFRCSDCTFEDGEACLLKVWAAKHAAEYYDPRKFGSTT